MNLLPPCETIEPCIEPPVIAVVTTPAIDDGENFALTTACEGHAPEVVHEFRSCYHPDEFVILTAPTPVATPTTTTEEN